MARRTKDEAEQTRNAILDAAEKVFYACGVARTSLQEVAKAANVTRGAVYWHFKNKLEILDAMVERVLLPQEDILEKLASSATDTPLEDLNRACQDGLALIMSDPQRLRVFTIVTQRCEYTEEMTPILTRRRACKARMLDRFTRLFKRAQRLKILAPNWPPTLAAMTLQGLMTGLFTLNLENAPERVPHSEASLDAFFRAVTRG